MCSHGLGAEVSRGLRITMSCHSHVMLILIPTIVWIPRVVIILWMLTRLEIDLASSTRTPNMKSTQTGKASLGSQPGPGQVESRGAGDSVAAVTLGAGDTWGCRYAGDADTGVLRITRRAEDMRQRIRVRCSETI